MKTFKIIDCIVQVVLIFGGLLFNLLSRRELLSHSFLMNYVFVGSWQIISLITHFFFPAEYKIGLRRIYSWLLVLTAAIFLICIFSPDLLINIMFGLLFWSPALALLYLITSILELKKMNTVKS